MNRMENIDLHDFEDYLRKRKLAPERNLPFYVRWVQRFLADLALQRNVAASTQNQAFGALLFLLREVLGQDTVALNSVRAKRTPHLPTVFSESEVARVLAAVKMVHERELTKGHGDVELPYALAVKYPKAAWE